MEPSLTTTTLHLDSTTKKATITLSGPNGKWFSVGFNTPNFAMSDKHGNVMVCPQLLEHVKDDVARTAELQPGLSVRTNATIAGAPATP